MMNRRWLRINQRGDSMQRYYRLGVTFTIWKIIGIGVTKQMKVLHILVLVHNCCREKLKIWYLSPYLLSNKNDNVLISAFVTNQSTDIIIHFYHYYCNFGLFLLFLWNNDERLNRFQGNDLWLFILNTQKVVHLVESRFHKSKHTYQQQEN